MYITFLPTHQIILSKPPEICSGFLPDLYDQSMKANEYIPYNLHHGPHRDFEPIQPSPHLLESFLGERKWRRFILGEIFHRRRWRHRHRLHQLQEAVGRGERWGNLQNLFSGPWRWGSIVCSLIVHPPSWRLWSAVWQSHWQLWGHVYEQLET